MGAGGREGRRERRAGLWDRWDWRKRRSEPEGKENHSKFYSLVLIFYLVQNGTDLLFQLVHRSVFVLFHIRLLVLVVCDQDVREAYVSRSMSLSQLLSEHGKEYEQLLDPERESISK